MRHPRVLLVLDEANNANLIGASGHEVRALAELQKDSYGLDIHILVQSLDFPNPQITNGVLTNCKTHRWFYNANASMCRKASEDFGDNDYVSTIRTLKVGECVVKDRDIVRFEKVPALPNPWVFPELAARKTRRAIEEIRKRPEYGGDDECSLGENEKPQSSDGPSNTSAQRDTSSISSPAKRLRTEKSRRCGGGET